MGTVTERGPYNTERETLTQPMALEISALHAAGHVRSGDPDRIVSGTRMRYFEAACAESGVTLGAFDRRTLAWLASWEDSTAQVLIGLIRRAHQAGRTAPRTANVGE